jgi:hypothetical protein
MALEEDRTGTWQAYGKAVPDKTNPKPKSNTSGDKSKSAFTKPISATGNSCFADYLAAHLPEVAATLDETDFGRLHLEVCALKIATHEAIQKRDWLTVRKHFTFIDNVLEAAETELHDAIGVSYLINLFYNETSINFAKARTLMPKRLATALEIMERHYEDMA